MSKSRKRVSMMPAIREESNLNSNRIPVHIIPPGARQGPLQSSMIIQNLPEEPQKLPSQVTPGTRHPDSVEQVVAEYLHLSQYGEVLPVSQGFAPLACPCCMDRNRENMKGLKEKHQAPPPEPDPDPDFLPPPLSPESGDEARKISPPRPVYFSEAERRHFHASWMDHQKPAPYAQTYLASEFHRAAILQRYEEDRKQYDDTSMAYVSGRVLDANTKYDLAMKKLERTLNNFAVSREESDLSYR